MNSSAPGHADSRLAAQFVDGPRLFTPLEAERRFAGWLADLESEQAAASSRSRSNFRAPTRSCSVLPKHRPICST